MSSIKVSALTAKTSPSGSEELLINDGGISKKITISNAVTATDLPTAPSGITTDTNKEYNLKLTDSGGTETLTWVEETDNDTVYTHPSTAGNKHIPSGGSAGEFLKYSSSGTATWASDNDTVYTHPTTDGNLHVPATSTTNNGKILTAGSTAGSISWENAPVSLPTQSDPTTVGKYLQSDGTAASWATVDTDSNTTTKGLYEHAHTINTAYSITSTNNAMSAGPVTIGSSGSVTIPSTSVWTIV